MSFRSAASAPPKFELLSLEFQVQVDHRMGVQEMTFEVSEQGSGPGRSWCFERNILRAGGKREGGREQIAEGGQGGQNRKRFQFFSKSKHFCSPKLSKQYTKARGRR